ncbi:MAG: galactokinase [Thermoguttaceae bacterium]|nr:galactokinase [Thermoguttaceae bacterium]
MLEKLLQEAKAAFQKNFHRDPKWIVTAPGRVNVIGEHTDYNEGFVFPMAIERNVIICAAPVEPEDKVPAGMAKVFSTAKKNPALVKVSGEIHPGPRVDWFEYVQGVIAGYLAENPSVEVGPFVATIHTNVPLGAALSSSAALEVSVGTLLEAISGANVDPVRKAFICQKAEHEYAQMPCGIMDQFISAMGQKDHIMLLDCRDCTTKLVPFTSPELSILIINSRVKHQLSGSEYPERRAACFDSAKILGAKTLREVTMEQVEANKEKLTDAQYRRARHVVSEIKRTTDAVAAIEAGNYELMGQLMYESHDSMRDDFEISCRELDILVEEAKKIGLAGGVYGSRMTGGGFGGCTVSLIQTSKMDSIMETIRKNYKAQTGIDPDLFVTRPAQGAHIIQK